MQNEKYKLQSDGSHTHFEFISEGPKGAIQKLIEFQPTSIPNFYNLALGDKNLVTGEMDDKAVSNNGDMNKILATVSGAVKEFFKYETEAIIYATGSIPTRTRLYRVGLTKIYDEIQNDFYLYGQMNEKFYVFEVGKSMMVLQSN